MIFHIHLLYKQNKDTMKTQSNTQGTEVLDVVIETSGHFNLDANVFSGDVRVENPETGKTRLISGEHGEKDYDWNGHWNP